MALVESFSGIRGVYGKDLTDDIALRYAYSYAQFLNKKDITVVIGRDTRKSGEQLRKALIEGLDCDILDVGALPTPAVELAVRKYKADGGIIITASHNEPEFNGFKFLDKDGAVLRPKDIQQVIGLFHQFNELEEEEFLGKLYKENKMERVKRVEIKHKDCLHHYKKFLLRFLSKEERNALRDTAKIRVDPNGGAGTVCKEIFDELGIKAEYIHMEEGTFKRLIEPNEKSLASMKISKGHFGAGFDCDADRVELVTEKGVVRGSELLALIVDDALSRVKDPEKETVVANDATSYVVKDIVDDHHAKWKEVEVGEINVVDTMIAFNSPVGGEGSNGGIILPPSRCRDGILTLIKIAALVGRKEKSLSELIDGLPSYFYRQEKIKKDFHIRERIKQHYLDKGFTIEETGDESGGLKAIGEKGWIWFRQSKTEDKVTRVIVDSKDELYTDSLLREGKKLFER
ncbi:hypothetical protein GOV09_06555 [Candidatus Woesearchaeota archaeon]|nr:hypothetical protein [Candidatus Woesearchaeota archaeon]